MNWENFNPHPQPDSQAWTISSSAMIPPVPGPCRGEGRDVQGQMGRRHVHPSAPQVPGRGSMAGPCLAIHSPGLEHPFRWILGATHVSIAVLKLQLSRRQRPKFATEMASSSLIYRLNLRANPQANRPRKKIFFPLFLLLPLLNCIGAGYHRTTAIFLQKKCWNLVQGKACNISQALTTLATGKYTLPSLQPPNAHRFLIITWEKSLDTSLFPLTFLTVVDYCNILLGGR